METFKASTHNLGTYHQRCSEIVNIVFYTQCLERVLDQLLPLHIFWCHTSPL